MNINTQPFILTRHTWQHDLVFRVLHDDEVRYFRPAVGDFLCDVPADSRLVRLDVDSLLEGDTRVLIQTHQGEQSTEYEKLHFEYAIMWAQWLKYMNPTHRVSIIEIDTRWDIVMPNTESLYKYIGMLAQGDPDRSRFMLDTTLKNNINDALIVSGIIPEPKERIVNHGGYSRVESKKGS